MQNLETFYKVKKNPIKMNVHRFPGKNVVQTCQSCNIIEDSNKLVLVCKDYTNIFDYFSETYTRIFQI